MLHYRCVHEPYVRLDSLSTVLYPGRDIILTEGQANLPEVQPAIEKGWLVLLNPPPDPVELENQDVDTSEATDIEDR